MYVEIAKHEKKEKKIGKTVFTSCLVTFCEGNSTEGKSKAKNSAIIALKVNIMNKYIRAVMDNLLG